MKCRPAAPFFPWGRCVIVSCLTICWAHAQTGNLDQEFRIRDLPSLTARSTEASDLLATALEIVFNNRDVCCGKNSAVAEDVPSSDPRSLKDIANKLRGKHLLSDGRTVTVATEYLSPGQVTADHVIYKLREKHAPLMIWNSQLYVVEGVTYVVTPNRGAKSYFLHKFLLLDCRFSDSRREVTFDRSTGESGEVEGLLFLEASEQ
jgi:hypothetical protein